MYAREIAQAFIDQGPYPLARRWQLFFEEKPAAYQGIAWTRQFCHDMLQYVTLLLVADYLKNQQSPSLLPHYQMNDWAELLGKLVALKRESRVACQIAQIQRLWTTARVTLGSQEMPLWHALLAEGSRAFDLWDTDSCQQIMLAMCDGMKPLYENGWGLAFLPAAGAGNGKPLHGAKPVDLASLPATSRRKSGDLTCAHRVLVTSGDGNLDMFPFFLLDATGQFWMWDGEISKDDAIYHSEFHRQVCARTSIPGYAEAGIRTLFPGAQDNAGRARNAVYQTIRYVTQQEQSGRYQSLAYLPSQELAGELNNFVIGKSASAALISARQGAGKLNLVCHMAQEWQRRGHIVIIQEAQDVGAKTFRNVIPLVPITEGKRCILVLPKIEEHPNITNFFSYLQEFLQIYGHPQSGLRLVMVCDLDVLQLLIKNDPLLLPFRFLYRPQLRAGSELAFALEPGSCDRQTTAAMYRCYQKIPDCRLASAFDELQTTSQDRIGRQPMWLRLITAGANGWRIPPSLKPDEMIGNYLSQHVWERPPLGQAIEALMPLLSDSYPLPLPVVVQTLEEAQLPSDSWREGVRQGVFEIRRSVEGKESLSFVMPVVKAFLWAKYLQKNGTVSELFKNGDHLRHYHAMMWTAVLCALKDQASCMLTLLQELSYGPQLVADALCTLEELRPTATAGKDRWDTKTAQMCNLLLQQRESLFLQQKELAVSALLEFFTRLSQRHMNEAYMRVEQLLIAHFPQLGLEQQLKFWDIVTRHYATLDIPRAKEAGGKWWQSVQQLENPVEKRQVAYALAQVYEQCNMPSAALEMGKLALRIAQEFSFFEESYQSLQWLASFYARQNKLAEAQDCYEQMLPLADKLENRVAKLTVWQRRALLYSQAGNLTAAIACYEKIRETAALFADRLAPLQAYQSEAACYEIGDQYQEALKMYQKAHQLAGDLSLHDKTRLLAAKITELTAKMTPKG